MDQKYFEIKNDEYPFSKKIIQFPLVDLEESEKAAWNLVRYCLGRMANDPSTSFLTSVYRTSLHCMYVILTRRMKHFFLFKRNPVWRSPFTLCDVNGCFFFCSHSFSHLKLCVPCAVLPFLCYRWQFYRFNLHCVEHTLLSYNSDFYQWVFPKNSLKFAMIRTGRWIAYEKQIWMPIEMFTFEILSHISF